MISRDFDKLINSFTKLPSVGLRSAERFAYAIINMNKEDAINLANNILNVKNNIKLCSICGNFTTEDVCSICQNRKSNILCIVKEPKDIVKFEKIKGFDCKFHILHGTLSPMKNITPDHLNIAQLLRRIDSGEYKEVIIALGTDVESEATSMYLAKLLKPLNIKVSRLAQGISLNSEIEYVDSATLQRAFLDRKEI